jgi:SAM-dependent methyltransferase
MVTPIIPPTDPLGLALEAFLSGRTDAKITVHSDFTEDEFIPVNYLFREEQELPELERLALKECRGTILDIGAGAGSHALLLQEKGLDVTAVDISAKAVEVMQQRGVAKARCIDIFELKNEKYDTLLMLMNGIGLVGTLDGLDTFLAHAKSLLKPHGQMLLDSTDIIYMFEDEDGCVWIDLNSNYYGEVRYQMEFDNQAGAEFGWLFVGMDILSDHAKQAGFQCNFLYSDDNNQYLARLVPFANEDLD